MQENSEPTNQVPPEILGEIFSWAMVKSEKLCMTEQDRRELVTLTLVCKGWHEAALEQHHLWSRVRLRTSRAAVLSKGILSWFAKARSHPKRLAIEADSYRICCTRDGSPGVEVPCDLGQFEFLLAGLVLDCLILWIPASCFRTFLSRMQALSSASWISIRNVIWCCRGASWSTSRSLAILPPSLSYLELQQIELLSDGQSGTASLIPPATLQQLKSLNLDLCGGDVSPVAGILQHCRNLQYLAIDHPFADLNFAPGDLSRDSERLSEYGTIHLPALTSLSLRIHFPSDPGVFLRHLHAPSLTTLQIHNDRYLRPNDRELWQSLNALHLVPPTQCGANLRSLTLFANTYPPSEVSARVLFDVLTDLPSLSHLRLQKVTFDAQEFLGLQKARPEADPELAQRGFDSLEQIELQYPGFDFHLDAFFEYVEMRSTELQRGVRDTLKKVDLTFCKGLYREGVSPELVGVGPSLFLEQFLKSSVTREGKTLSGVTVNVFLHEYEK